MLQSILAITISTFAATAASAQEQAAQPDWIEQARIVAQAEGISVGKAVKRARLQEKLNQAIKRFEGDPDYAGAWIEQD